MSKTIILTAEGDFSEMPCCLESIRKHSPKCRVIMLADRDYSHGTAEFFDINKYKNDSNFLKPRYHHHSSNPPDFEWKCLSRFLSMNELAFEQQIEEIVSPDWDYLLFSEFDEVGKQFDEADFTTSMPAGSVSQGFSQDPLFINNSIVLSEYSRFVINCYESPTRFEQVLVFGHGHVSCMTFWNVFRQQFGFKTMDTSVPIKGAAFNHNLCLPQPGYAWDGKSLILTFMQGKPYVKQEDGSYIRFHSLHCWGIWKNRMRELLNRAEASLPLPIP